MIWRFRLVTCLIFRLITCLTWQVGEAKAARETAEKVAEETGTALDEAMAALDKAEREGRERALRIAALENQVYMPYERQTWSWLEEQTIKTL